MRTHSDLAYGSHPAQRMDLHLPEENSHAVFLYFHGGGLEAGDKGDQTLLFDDLTRHGIAVFSANYRMYPEAHYPAFVEDAAAAAVWVLRHGKEHGAEGPVFVGGSSAGGYLSMVLCFDAGRLGALGCSPLDFAGFLHDAGQPTCHYNVLRERGVDPRRVLLDESAPLYHVGTAEALPPVRVIVSDDDMPGRYEQTMLLLRTLKEFGTEVPCTVMHGGHCAYVDAADEQGASVFGKIVRSFVESTLQK